MQRLVFGLLFVKELLAQESPLWQLPRVLRAPRAPLLNLVEKATGY